MNDYIIDRNQLSTESDVEQKVIYPLITKTEPQGLGFDSTEILTKHNLKKLDIDKGSKSVLYFPDYIINVKGIPLIIIEAKRPDEDLDEAFREASLYAGELNRKFDSKVNPCHLIMACDGIRLLAGNWDSAKPQFDIGTAQWNYAESAFNDFCNTFSKSSVEKVAVEFKKIIRVKKYFWKPLILVGKHAANRATENKFGETISLEYRHLFNPNEEAEKIDIVHNAYVKVRKHESHVLPIDRLIRNKVNPVATDSVLIEDNTNPHELIKKLNSARDYNNQVLLLIGSVGSGKSTFTTYLKEIALSPALVDSLTWITLNLNNAPVAASEIYLWVKESIIEQLRKSVSGIDFDEISFIEELYEEKINSLKKGELSYLDANSEKYKEYLVESIRQFRNDINLTLESYIKLLVHKVGRELVIVLDNCDKRSLEEQLLMFEVANWIKESIKAIVFLPLRDTTFDHFRRQKPLDTVVKDLIFRINPPSLKEVLYERVKYAHRLGEGKGDRYYTLDNGIRVSYPSTEQLYYLKSILSSLFENHFFRRLISGLAGGDTRVGLEIFLDFCKSGYISENDIFMMRQSKGTFVFT